LCIFAYTFTGFFKTVRGKYLNMAFNNRKFSMNRQTGVPRESTRAGDKITRRFSTHEPSANGMYLFLRSLWFVRNAVALRCSPNNYITRARHERKETPKQEELGCSADSQNTISRLEERSRRSRARKPYTFPFSASISVFHT
jgi:hypothetical protein